MRPSLRPREQNEEAAAGIGDWSATGAEAALWFLPAGLSPSSVRQAQLRRCRRRSFGWVGGQGEGAFVGRSRLIALSEGAEEFGTGGVEQVVVVQVVGEGVHFAQCGGRPGEVAQGDRAVQPGHR